MKLDRRIPLFRMTQIRRKLLRGESFNAPMLAAELEVTPKTIFRDLYFMRDFLNYEIAYNPKTHSWEGKPSTITTL